MERWLKRKLLRFSDEPGRLGGRRAGREGAGGWGGGAAGSREGEACRTMKQRKKKIATKWLPD